MSERKREKRMSVGKEGLLSRVFLFLAETEKKNESPLWDPFDASAIDVYLRNGRIIDL